MLTLQHISTGYKKKVVGKDLCGHLTKGSLTALLGLNGCGKSTLLRTISRLQAPLEGEIFMQKQPLSQISIKRLAQLLSVVLTYQPHASELTALDVVKMGRIPYRSTFSLLQSNDFDLIDKALHLTHSTNLALRKLNTLSDGERQRIFIAKALAQDTPIILLDEPTAFLDFANKVSTMQLLRQLAHTEGKTILLSTHDVELALHFADNLWMLNTDGITEGEPHTLAHNGDISHFFCTKGIRFDAMQMRFYYK